MFHVQEFNIVGITKLRFFPVINYGRTIYLVEERMLFGTATGKMRLVPIGYSLYDDT
jgi:hypothetical protein